MKKLFEQWRERFDAFSLRERLMFMLAGLLVIFVLVDNLLLTAVDKQRRNIAEQLKDVYQRNQELDVKIQEVTLQLQASHNEGNSTSVAELHKHLQQSNKELENLVVQFVKPQEMVDVLREVLKDVNGLKLMRVKSIGAVELIDSLQDKSIGEQQSKYKQALRALKLYQQQVQVADQAQLTGKFAEYLEKQEKQGEQKDALPKIYKHGILLELSGSYTATLQYLRMLENLPWKFYWEAMRFEIVDYPTAKISIVIDTLSLNKEWVRV